MARSIWPVEVADWISRWTALLHETNGWRLSLLLGGMLFARGRLTVASWLRAGELGLHVLDRLLAGLRGEIGGNALLQSVDLRAGVGIGSVGGDGGVDRDVLQLVAQRFLVGARAILHVDRLIDARNGRTACGTGAVLASVP